MGDHIRYLSTTTTLLVCLCIFRGIFTELTPSCSFSVKDVDITPRKVDDDLEDAYIVPTGTKMSLNISFEIESCKMNDDSNITLCVDYGDGTGFTSTLRNIAESFGAVIGKIYLKNGDYNLSVRLMDQTSKINFTSYTTLISVLSASSLYLTEEYYDDRKQQLTLLLAYSGNFPSLFIDYDDDSNKHVFNLSDTSYFIGASSIFSENVVSLSLQRKLFDFEVDEHLIASPFGVARKQGIITHIELYPLRKGILQLQVLRPEKKIDWNLTTCFDPSCFIRKYAFVKNGTKDSFTYYSAREVNFTILNINEWVQLPVELTVKIYPGDLIAFVVSNTAARNDACSLGFLPGDSNYGHLYVRPAEHGSYNMEQAIQLNGTYMIRASVLSSMIEVQHIYAWSGRYNVKMNLISTFVNSSAHHEYEVNVDPKLSIDSVKTTLDTHDESIIHYKIVIRTNLKRFHVDMNYGDRSSEKWNITTESAIVNTARRHKYAKAGQYRYVVNAGDVKPFAGYVRVPAVGNITGVVIGQNVTRRYVTMKESVRCEQNEKIKFEIFIKGFVNYFKIYINETQSSVRVNESFLYVPSKIGKNDVCIIPFSSKTYGNRYCFILMIVSHLDGLTVIVPETDVSQGYTFNIYVQPDPPALDLCIMLHDGTDSNISAYGPVDLCKDSRAIMFKIMLFRQDPLILRTIADNTSDLYISDSLYRSFLMSNFTAMSGSIVRSYPYKIGHSIEKTGPTDITVMVWNGIYFKSRVIRMMVHEDVDCVPPKLSIRALNEQQISQSGLIYYRTSHITLNGIVDVKCNLSFTTVHTWNILQLDLDGRDVRNFSDLHDIDASGPSLRIPAGYLPTGRYKCFYTVELRGEELPKWFNFKTNVSILIVVKGSPLIAKMIPDDASIIELGPNTSVILSPEKYSTFRNRRKIMEFAWFCRRLPYETLFDSFGEYIQNSLKVISKNINSSSQDHGGCFGSGPGRVDINGGYWMVTSETFKKSGLTYEIVVRVSSEDYYAYRALQIIVRDELRPVPNIRCQNSELCQPQLIGYNVNPYRLGIVASCLSHCEDRVLSTLWTLSFERNGIYYPIINSSLFLTLHNESAIAIKQDAFNHVQEELHSTKMKVTLRTTTKIGSGFAHLLLTINRLPRNGHCSVSNRIGLALVQEFKINCYNWFDPDPADFVSRYEYWIRKADEDVTLLITFGSSSEVIRLPYGIYTLGANIYDSFGGSRTYHISRVSVIAPPESDYDTFMATEFPAIVSRGDRAMINMITSSAISLFQDVYGAPSVLLRIRNQERISMDPLKNKEVTDAVIKEVQAKSYLLSTINENMNSDTLQSIQLFGNALTTIIGTGETLDEDSKEICLEILDKLLTSAMKIRFESPQSAMNVVGYIAGAVGALLNRLSDFIISRRFLPTDLIKALDLDIPVDNPDPEDALQDDFLDFDRTEEEMLKDAMMYHIVKKSKDFVTSLLSKTDALIKNVVASSLVENEVVNVVTKSRVHITYGKFELWQLSGRTISHEDNSVTFPKYSCSLFPSWKNCTGNETILIMATTYPSIVHSYGKYANFLENRTSTQQLRLYDENYDEYRVANTSELIDIFVAKRNTQRLDVVEAVPQRLFVVPKIRTNELLVYHQFQISQPKSAIKIRIETTKSTSRLVIFVRQRHKPTIERHDRVFFVTSDHSSSKRGDRELFIKNRESNFKPGIYYMGVAQLKHRANLGEVRADDIESIFTTNYTVVIFSSACFFFNNRKNEWSSDGCYVQDMSLTRTWCRCNHLTSFARGFVIVPNTINFTYVFTHSGFDDNKTVYVTVMVICAVYLVTMIWARRKDRSDLIDVGITPLPDNKPDHIFLYEILVETGNVREAGTKSNVSFILVGDNDETNVRTLSDDERNILRTGSRDSFVLATPRSLGQMKYVRMWHDNSGEGKFASWYLNSVMVTDLQTNNKYVFLAQRWFAVEKGSGKVDHVIPAASVDELRLFKNRFDAMSRRSLSDDHLWFSVFTRSPRSRFNRVARVSCCMVVLCISMLVNAMWYRKVPSKPQVGMNFGLFSLSPEEIAVGIISNLIVFPITFFIVALFRRSRLRYLRPSRFRHVLATIRLHRSPNHDADDGVRKLVDASIQISRKNFIEKLYDSIRCSLSSSEVMVLPWWCRQIAWTIVIVVICGSLFLVCAYCIDFGDEKSTKWIKSLVVSLLTSILITQPLKVFLMSALLSLICTIDSGGDNFDEDEQPPDLLPSEEYLHREFLFGPKKKRRRRIRMKEQMELMANKDLRLKEIEMWKIFSQILAYVVFLTMILVLSYGNRDPNAYRLQQNLRNSFVKDGDPYNDFNKVTVVGKYWNWTRSVVVPALRVGRWYNGRQPFGLRGYLDDRVSKLMGYAVLRQIRIKPVDCRMSTSFATQSPGCRGFGNIVDEDGASYNSSGWTRLDDSTADENSNDDEYVYRTSTELRGHPFVAKFDAYGGGGYVYRLRGSRTHLVAEMNRLQRSNWIDENTRAVFLEFSVYNAQSNLFGIATVVAEFFPGGGIRPCYRFDAIRLLRYHRDFGLVVLVSEMLAALVVSYFTYRQIEDVGRLGKRYFDDRWNVVELLLLFLSYLAIGLYVLRHVLTARILNDFERHGGNGYVKLQLVSVVDDAFGDVVAFVQFFSILKLIRLARFNRRMNMLADTLRHLQKDLFNYGTIFLVIVCAFAQLFYSIFGTKIFKFSTFVTALESTGSIMLGKFDFFEIYRNFPFLGPSAFFVFSVTSRVVLVNFLMTLIIVAFDEVKRDLGNRSNDHEIVDFILEKFRSWLGLSPGRRRSVHPQMRTRSESVLKTRRCCDRFCETVDRFAKYVDRMAVVEERMTKTRDSFPF